MSIDYTTKADTADATKPWDHASVLEIIASMKDLYRAVIKVALNGPLPQDLHIFEADDLRDIFASRCSKWVGLRTILCIYISTPRRSHAIGSGGEFQLQRLEMGPI